jgi:phosphohistidine phosphatase SixA
MGSGRAPWWALRTAAALCFIGHGAFGILTKAAWVPFFGLVGIGRDTAFTLMPVIGVVDIVVGLTVLISPRPAALLYMVVWAIWTAALRPLSGDSVFEMLERAGNYGVPLAMLAMCWPRAGWRDWFAPATPRTMTPLLQRTLAATLAATTALLLLGHGALGIAGVPGLASRYASLGLSPDVATGMTPAIGWLEVVLAGLIVVRPSATLAFGIALWKVATESLWLVSGSPIWEFVERAGSYAAPLGLALLIGVRRSRVTRSRVPAAVAILALSAAVPLSATAQGRDSLPRQEGINQLEDRSLVAALRAGGLVLFCRHAATVSGVSDESETDRALQRNLSEEGRQQSIAIGRAVRAARVKIGPVVSSPMFRTRETAALAFGDSVVVVTPLLRGKQSISDLMKLILDGSPEGHNRVLMTHQAQLYRVLTMFRRPEIREGDCVILRPDSETGTFKVIAKLGPADWERLAKL